MNVHKLEEIVNSVKLAPLTRVKRQSVQEISHGSYIGDIAAVVAGATGKIFYLENNGDVTFSASPDA